MNLRQLTRCHGVPIYWDYDQAVFLFDIDDKTFQANTLSSVESAITHAGREVSTEPIKRFYICPECDEEYPDSYDAQDCCPRQVDSVLRCGCGEVCNDFLRCDSCGVKRFEPQFSVLTTDSNRAGFPNS